MFRNRHKQDQEELTINRKSVTYISILIVIAVVSAVAVNTIYNSGPIRVACIGDSITQYSGYTDELQTMLGPDYNVSNFGRSGATAMVCSETPYIYQNESTKAKEYNPNIAVIMLGTNDARTDHFKSVDNFITDYKEIISMLQGFGRNPKIFLVKPPPIFENNYSLESANFVDGIIPRIEQMADELGLTVIDVYSEMKDHPEYFGDGVHPNSEGTTIIAEKVYEAISSYTETSSVNVVVSCLPDKSPQNRHLLHYKN